VGIRARERAPGERPHEPEAGDRLALCLSGGGYRAMLFHLGSLWRLNELGYLPKLDRVSSVSGGSIAAGVLGARWRELSFDEAGVAVNFDDTVAGALLGFAGKTSDVRAVICGLLGARPAANRLAAAYRRRLFGSYTLQDLPDRPQFVFNATNLQTGGQWCFSKARMADRRVGEAPAATVALALAVAAASAFPPFLAPLHLKLARGVVVEFPGEPAPPLHFPPYTTKIVLCDGGVYDNLGLQQAGGFGEVLVSDGGARIAHEESPSGLWPLQVFRALRIMDNQVRTLRTRKLIASLEAPAEELRGAYWGIRTAIEHYDVPTLPAAQERTLELAQTPTRLAALPLELRHRLVNWGYAVCDAAMRAHVLPKPPLPPPTEFPFPGGV
jgi:NTE family protein